MNSRRRLLAILAACTAFAAAPLSHADDAARTARLEGYIAAQAVSTPFLRDRMLPFLVRVALTRKLTEAGRDGALGEDWNRDAPEWQAREGRSNELAAEAIRNLTPPMSIDEARALLEDVSDDDFDTLLAFQRSPLAQRMIKAADYGISALLMTAVPEGQVPESMQLRRRELIGELEDHQADLRLSAEDQAELQQLFQKPVFGRVAQANQARLQQQLGSGGGPLKRLNGVLQREVDAAIAAFRNAHATETEK